MWFVGEHRLSRRGASAVVAALVVLGLSSPQPAAAASLPPGVHVDPNSPAAKEYAIPLGQARAGNSSGGAGSQKPFGSGITSVGTASSSPPGTAAASSATTSGSPRVTPRRTRARRSTGAAAIPLFAARPISLAKIPPPSRLLGSDHGGTPGVIWMLGVAALVLALGGLGGGALARRSRGANPGTG
jgi:hypothetical protein